MESEKTLKSAKGEAATTAERQFTAERHSETYVGSAEGGKMDHAVLPLSGLACPRVCIFGWDEANTLFSTPLKEDLGYSGYLSTFLGFYLSFFHYYSSRFTMNMVN
ncbi:hypothetical protein LR48_Vigan10g142100 [Vigna angularis]|uniref:Uncharacterized protein n=1 Tax=Phaseolus angularis TaxID=3914 RepID=A0A0L9VLD0_PHAAN|nr:hypothetical protein LR48_Vigan10g142100 [Vigna angularis]